jgi:hypothetical protein
MLALALPIIHPRASWGSPELHNFFNAFSTETQGLTFKKSTPQEKIIIDIAEDWQEKTISGHGMFFDFSQTPEIEKPILDYLIKGFGWKLETPFFIRKPL